ncbi:hypothetical protein T440DRAFT_52116 [Plenodomus tracheiphilus IPT5]|uniref:Uncharacterized protein n=1 Tax=Plenodomus tracheiphilus IPT5 TaxID=1408161 RepID=A0A6A7BBJ4_9PLEO|nr:hypothetical protein T440DRAFT_52116 [Plenodomus tracheiphilus IPT5]
MYVSLPETRFSDNSGDEPITELAPPNHVDITVSQPFRRWMTPPRRRHLERRKVWHTKPLVYRSVSKMTTRMGRYRQILARVHTQHVRVNNLFHWDMKTASMTVGSIRIALRSDAG